MSSSEIKEIPSIRLEVMHPNLQEYLQNVVIHNESGQARRGVILDKFYRFEPQKPGVQGFVARIRLGEKFIVLEYLDGRTASLPTLQDLEEKYKIVVLQQAQQEALIARVAQNTRSDIDAWAA